MSRAGHLDPAAGRDQRPVRLGASHRCRQYTSIAVTDRLVEAGIDASVGSVGDAYDCALAESQIGLFKSELIHPHGPWRDRDHLEAAVLDWVDWFNTERPHESIDDLTPDTVEELHYRHRARLTEAG